MPEHRSLDRRSIIHGGLVAGMATLAGSEQARAAPVPAPRGSVRFRGTMVRFVDLSHRLTKAFNFDPSKPRIAAEPIDGSGKAVGMRLNRLSLVEHTGTHIDAPSHFDAAGASLGEIPIEDLVVPLAVVDVRNRFAGDRNYELQASDIAAWERRHGRLPPGCCVAMFTGFDPLAPRPAGAGGSPGFSSALIDTLIRQRSVKGVAVDSMSIDSGSNVPAYPFHQAWLRSGRWGIEGLTNLGEVPPSGAVLFVGAAPIAEATGVPIRAVGFY